MLNLGIDLSRIVTEKLIQGLMMESKEERLYFTFDFVSNKITSENITKLDKKLYQDLIKGIHKFR